MELKKEIVMSGTSACIRLTAENLKLYKLKVGEVIDIRIRKVSTDDEEKDYNRSRDSARMAGGGHRSNEALELAGLEGVKRGRKMREEQKEEDIETQKKVDKLRKELKL